MCPVWHGSWCRIALRDEQLSGKGPSRNIGGAYAPITRRPAACDRWLPSLLRGIFLEPESYRRADPGKPERRSPTRELQAAPIRVPCHLPTVSRSRCASTRETSLTEGSALIVESHSEHGGFTKDSTGIMAESSQYAVDEHSSRKMMTCSYGNHLCLSRVSEKQKSVQIGVKEGQDCDARMTKST
jgi:hypothetical protein